MNAALQMSWLYSDNLSTPSLLCHHANNTRLACAKVLVRLSTVLTYCGAHGTALSSGADYWVCIPIGLNGGPMPTYSTKFVPWVFTTRNKKLQKQLTTLIYMAGHCTSSASMCCAACISPTPSDTSALSINDGCLYQSSNACCLVQARWQLHAQRTQCREGLQ